MKTLALNRRELFALTGGAMMAAGAVTAVNSGADAADALPDTDGATVVLQDRRLPLPQDLRQNLAAGVRLLTLERDPVRMWRGEHAALLKDPATRLMGVTPWIEFVMIRGLAEESRKRVRYHRFDADSNAVVWLIA